MELTARIHIEVGGCWADVSELPGCFASGDTLGELVESLREGIVLYLADRTSFRVDDVNGHREFPRGGHPTSPLAATTSPHRWPSVLPA